MYRPACSHTSLANLLAGTSCTTNSSIPTSTTLKPSHKFNFMSPHSTPPHLLLLLPYLVCSLWACGISPWIFRPGSMFSTRDPPVIDLSPWHRFILPPRTGTVSIAIALPSNSPAASTSPFHVPLSSPLLHDGCQSCTARGSSPYSEHE